jgi:hypothetical protein
MAAQLSELTGNGFAAFSNLQRLTQPGFIGMAAGQAVAPIGAGLVCWVIAKAVPSLRNYAAPGAMAGVVAVLVAMLTGEYSLNLQRNNSAASVEPVPAQVSKAATPAPVPTEGWDLSSLPNSIDGRWSLVETTPDAKTYVDIQSVTGDTYQRNFWIKTYLKTGEFVSHFADSGPRYSTSLSHAFLRCPERTYAFGDNYTYSRSGVELKMRPGDSTKTFASVVPGDALNEMLFRLVCSNK